MSSTRSQPISEMGMSPSMQSTRTKAPKLRMALIVPVTVVPSRSVCFSTSRCFWRSSSRITRWETTMLFRPFSSY